MKKLIQVLMAASLLSQTTHAQETTVLIASQAADPTDYLAVTQGQSVYQTLSEWWVRHRVSDASLSELTQKLERAQTEFLQGSIDRARQEFVELLKLSDKVDWRESERKTFAYAELRLAQMSTDEVEKNFRVLAAARWGNVGLQRSLFPAPLWQMYQTQLRAKRQTHINVDQWFPTARHLLVDGKPYPIDPDVQFPLDAAVHRFTLVFDHSLPVSTSKTWSELSQWQPPANSIASGTCENPNVKPTPAVPASAKIFYAHECIVPMGNPISVALPAPLSVEAPKISKSNYKWLWVALGAVAVGSAVWLGQEEKPSSKPTTTIGF
jgi:hypothetical protein